MPEVAHSCSIIQYTWLYSKYLKERILKLKIILLNLHYNPKQSVCLCPAHFIHTALEGVNVDFPCLEGKVVGGLLFKAEAKRKSYNRNQIPLAKVRLL